MKKIAVLILLFFIGIVGIGQDYKTKVEKDFLAYTNLLIQKKFTQAVEYINADFFKIIPKSQMISLMEKTFNDPEIEFNIEETKVLEVGDEKKINGINYARLKYSNIIMMKFYQNDSDKDSTTIEEKIKEQELITSALEAEFGKNNVVYNDTTKYYKIFLVKNVVASSNDNINWSFVTIEERQKSLLEKFIPKELLYD